MSKLSKCCPSVTGAAQSASDFTTNVFQPLEKDFNHAKEQAFDWISDRTGIEKKLLYSLGTSGPIFGTILYAANKAGLINDHDLQGANDVAALVALTVATAGAAGITLPASVTTAAGGAGGTAAGSAAAGSAAAGSTAAASAPWTVLEIAQVASSVASLGSVVGGYMSAEEAAKRAAENEKNARIYSYQKKILNAGFSIEEIEAQKYRDQQYSDQMFDVQMSVLDSTNTAKNDKLKADLQANIDNQLASLDNANANDMARLKANIEYSNQMAKLQADKAYAFAANSREYFMTKAAITADEVATSGQISIDTTQSGINRLKEDLNRAREDLNIATDEQLSKMGSILLAKGNTGISGARVAMSSSIKADRAIQAGNKKFTNAIEAAYDKMNATAKGVNNSINAEYRGAIAQSSKAMADASVQAQFAFNSAAAGNNKDKAITDAGIIARAGETAANINLTQNRTNNQIDYNNSMLGIDTQQLVESKYANDTKRNNTYDYSIAQQNRIAGITADELAGMGADQLYYDPNYNIDYTNPNSYNYNSGKEG